MTLLRVISWPQLRKHLLRTALTTAGIALGVAVFVGMHVANQSVLHAFSETIDRIAGKTDLQITAGENGFPRTRWTRSSRPPPSRSPFPSSKPLST